MLDTDTGRLLKKPGEPNCCLVRVVSQQQGVAVQVLHALCGGTNGGDGAHIYQYELRSRLYAAYHDVQGLEVAVIKTVLIEPHQRAQYLTQQLLEFGDWQVCAVHRGQKGLQSNSRYIGITKAAHCPYSKEQ
jgi:hypothetical protein